MNAARNEFNYLFNYAFMDFDNYKNTLEQARFRGVGFDLDECRDLETAEDKRTWFYDLAERVQEAGDNSIMSIDAEVMIDITIGINGPTQFVRFYCKKDDNGYYLNRDNAEYHTSNNPQGKMEIAWLTENETQELFERWNIENYNG